MSGTGTPPRGPLRMNHTEKSDKIDAQYKWEESAVKIHILLGLTPSHSQCFSLTGHTDVFHDSSSSSQG